MVPGPVSVEVLVEGVEPMIKQARQISTWAPNVVIKIPASSEGLEVTSALAKEGIMVNFTLCFSVNQALLGALAGAVYISPFVADWMISDMTVCNWSKILSMFSKTILRYTQRLLQLAFVIPSTVCVPLKQELILLPFPIVF